MTRSAAARVQPIENPEGLAPRLFGLLGGIEPAWARPRILDHMVCGIAACDRVLSVAFVETAAGAEPPAGAIDFPVLTAGAGSPLTCRIVFYEGPDTPTRETLANAFTVLGTVLAGRERRALEQVIGETANLIRDLVIITDNDGVVTWVNPAFERLTGYRLADIAGRKPGDVLQGRGTDQAEVERMRRAIAEREPHFGEILNYAADGTPYWIEMDLSPFGDEQEGGFIAIERDITQRKDAFLRLEATERHMRAITDTVPAIISVAALDDPAKRFFVNRFWQEEYGVEAGEDGSIDFPGTPFLDQVIEDIKQGRTVYDRPQVQTSIDGDERHYRVFAQPLDWHGQPAALVLKVDTTDRVALGRDLEEARKYEELGLLAGRVAHDLNNRLQQMASAWDLLSMQSGAALSGNKYAERVETALSRLEEFGQSVLAFSRGRSMAPQFIDLGAALRKIDPTLSAMLPEGFRLDSSGALDVLAGAGVVTRLDPVRLEDALSNCITNARDAMPEGGDIVITAAVDEAAKTELSSTLEPKPEGTVTLSIIDSGAGMSADVQARALEPFFTTKRGVGGTGLGLSTVSGLAVRAGGKLSVNSEPGKGTRLDLLLPRFAPSVLVPSDAGESRKRSRSQRAPAAPGRASGAILIAEDEPEVRQALIDGLMAKGWRVYSAANGGDALAQLRQQAHLDVIICDYNLGAGPDGSDVAAAAKRTHPDAAFILITAGHEFREVEMLGDIPAVLLKPFQFQQLYDAIGKAKPHLLSPA